MQKHIRRWKIISVGCFSPVLPGKKRKPSSLNCTSAIQSPCLIFILLSNPGTSMPSVSRNIWPLWGSLIFSFVAESLISMIVFYHMQWGGVLFKCKIKNFWHRFKKVIVSKPYSFPMFVDLIMTSITDAVFFGGDESHGDWHQSARTSRAPHRHNDLYPLKNTQIPFWGESVPPHRQFCLKE